MRKQSICHAEGCESGLACLTIFFENPFWVGVFERIENEKLSVCKVTFGAEPRDFEVWELILKNYNHLRFSSCVESCIRKAADNPKRRQRNARKQLADTGIGTKSQQVLQKQREKIKIERKEKSRREREEEKQRLFERKQQKRKEKHRGH